MTINHRWGIPVMLIAGLQFVGCRTIQDTPEDKEKGNGPAKVEHMEGDEPARITLTEKAMKRLDLQMAPVTETEADGMQRLVVPYAAVLYDTEGVTWTYVNSAERTFVRHRISVYRIEGENAILAEGPPSGTQVVTVGAAELYGSEFEFAEE